MRRSRYSFILPVASLILACGTIAFGLGLIHGEGASTSVPSEEQDAIPRYVQDSGQVTLLHTTAESGSQLRVVSSLLPDVPIIFVSRNRLGTLDGHRVGPPIDVVGREVTPGGRLMVLWPDGLVTDLTAGTSLRDVQQPDVSFDGKKVVFSAVEEDGGQWHLYEVQLYGDLNLRRLTFADRDIPIPSDPLDPYRNEFVFQRYGDFGPAYLPDGRIIFASTRYMTLSGSCGHRGQNLYVLEPATGEMHRLTTLRAGAIDPAVLADGTIVYSQWIDATNEPSSSGPGLRPLETDYNFAVSFWGLWRMNPDGTGAGRYAFLRGGLDDFGGAHQPHELSDGALVATFRGKGSLLGDTLTSALTRIAPGPVEPHDLTFLGDPYTLEAPHALCPAPLADGTIVCSYTPTAAIQTDPVGGRTATFDFGLYVADSELNILGLLYNEPETDELDAVAAYARSAPIISDCPKADLITDDPEIDLGMTDTLVNHNVYADLPLDVTDIPSPKAGTVARVDIYDDSQTFFTSEAFPLLRKQMPTFVGSFPVDENGAFTAIVPADRALLFTLVNDKGVAVRSLLSEGGATGFGKWITHSFNGHDFLRPDDAIHCAGCHKGHMLRPELAMEGQANLSRLSTATASSEYDDFRTGAWRINDLRLASGKSRFSWITSEGPGAWIELAWPVAIRANQIVLYPIAYPEHRVIAGTLTLSDGASYALADLPNDGSPVFVPLEPERTFSWARFTVDDSTSRWVGLTEIVVNGPPDISLPDIAPPPPTNLSTTKGYLSLQWEPVPDPCVTGYRIYYGRKPGRYTESVDVGEVSWFLMRDLLEDGTTYYMAAKAYNVHGTESRLFSNEVSATVRAPVVTAIEPDHGPTAGGTFVTITGRNFVDRYARVLVGRHRAVDVTVLDPQTITAVTQCSPPSTVDVIVSNTDDMSGTLSAAFTYEEPE